MAQHSLSFGAAAIAAIVALSGCVGGPCTYGDPMTGAMTISAIEPTADAGVVAGEPCETVQFSPTLSGIIRSTTATRGCLASAGVGVNSAVNVQFIRIQTGTCTPVIVQNQPAWIEACAQECRSGAVVLQRDGSSGADATSDAAQTSPDGG
ncbi:MAG: hypothetical protein U0269_31665 [Polyangiales bacterium]